jgi:hypothetical protein
MRNLFLFPLLLFVLVLSLTGCDSGVEPDDTSIPVGLYLYSDQSPQGDVTLERHYSVILFSESEGLLTDTTYIIRDGQRTLDSIRETELSFANGGAGYRRAIEIEKIGGVPVDTTVHYWRFVRRGDSLFCYVGDRFTGFNIGLEGSWWSEPDDSAAAGWRTDLDFTGDSLRVRHVPDVGPGTGRFAYAEDHNILTLDKTSPFRGDRYQIIPGWALYITTRGTQGYVLVHR